MKMLNPTDEANKILADLEHDKILPIDVDSIALKLNIEVKYELFDDDLSGLLIKEEDRTVIGINSAHSINRQRFTMAHELGHYVLKHEGEVFVDKSFRSQTVMRRDVNSTIGTEQDEIQANQFAAALLMPEKQVGLQVNALLENKPNANPAVLINQLAKIFRVSEQAIEYRLTNLGYLIPAG
jgi:Zn-dependent peptidase ImmA (M78 family)